MNGIPLPSPKIVACPACHTSIQLIAHAQSRYLACGSCRRLWDTITPENWKNELQFRDLKLPLIIPIGRKGRLRGIVYAVTGYIRWKETQANYFWNEYVLFNPVHGYAFLSEFNGHWNYTVTADTYPYLAPSHRSFELAGDSFQLFGKYRQTPVFAVGEFAWDIDDDSPVIEEFVAPPFMLSREKNNDYLQWFWGEYIEGSEIKKAFNLPLPLPEKIGVGAIQPQANTTSIDTWKTITIASMVVLVVLQLLFSSFSKAEVLLKQTFTIAQDWGAAKPVVSPSFTVRGGTFNTSNLEFSLYSLVDNDWLEADITMVNEQTGEEYQFEVGVEYYSGYEGGESWSEGSRTESRFLSAIPDGRYHLNIFPSKGKMTEDPTFELQVERDVPMWSNFFIIALLVTIYPAMQWWRIYDFERKRWMNSDYSPYDV